MRTKQCKTCKKYKTTDKFYKSLTCKFGVRGVCKKCINKQRIVYNRKYRALHVEKFRAYHRVWHQQHKEKHLASAKKWKLKHKQRVKKYQRCWIKNNPGKVAATRALTLARSLQRTPKWLTKEHKQAIEFFYANRPQGYHVDHMVPLQGKLVSGLHVPWSLQYLSAKANRKKYNHFIPSMENLASRNTQT